MTISKLNKAYIFMAIMYPAFGPKANASQSAEPRVYQLLKEQLDDSFYIIHSTPWLSSVTESYSFKKSGMGEVDFLIFHPRLGSLAIEVKGGQLNHDRSGFYYLRQDGQKQSVEFDLQANRGRFALQNFLKKRGKTIKFGLAFFLCDCEVEQANLPPHLIDTHRNQTLVFDIRDTADIGKGITELMEYYADLYQHSTFSNSELEQIIDHILPTADFGPCWPSRIQNDDVIWLKMTDEQTECMTMAINRDRMIITGWPGSGKTIVGIAAARHLSSLGQKILFLAFNDLLTRKIRDQLKQNENCVVKSFHQLCSDAERDTGNVTSEKDKTWYEETSVKSLKKAINNGFLDTYDTLIVDESQIIRPEWWKVLIDKFGDQHIIAMCDETQAFPYETKMPLSELETILGTQHFLLTQSLRTPKRVCDKLKKIIPPSYSITNPRPTEKDTYQEQTTLNFGKTLVELLEEFSGDNILPAHVTFLVEYNREAFYWLVQQGYSVETIGRFRGVESPIVVILMSGKISNTTLFCAYSRCTSRCIAISWAADVAQNITTQIEPETKIKARELYDAYLIECSFNHKIYNPPLTLSPIILEPIQLQWCEQWQGYLLYTETPRNVVWHIWEDLTTGCPSFLYTCNDASTRTFRCYFPIEENTDQINSRVVYIEDCLSCLCATPHYEESSQSTCTICSGPCHPGRSQEFEESQHKWSEIVSRKETFTRDEKRTLPLPLFVLLSLRSQKLLKNDTVIQCIIEAGGEKYKWILCLLLVLIYRSKPNQKYLVIKEIIDKLQSWNTRIEQYSRPSLSGRISSALEKLDRLEVTRKTGKSGEREINFESSVFD